MVQSKTHGRKLVVSARPKGKPDKNTLRLETDVSAPPDNGQRLPRDVCASLAPDRRDRMSEAPSCTAPVAIGAVRIGGTVAQIALSEVEGSVAGD